MLLFFTFYLIVGYIQIAFLIYFIKEGAISECVTILPTQRLETAIIPSFTIMSGLYYLINYDSIIQINLIAFILIYMSILLSIGDILTFFVIPEIFWAYTMILFSVSLVQKSISFFEVIIIVVIYFSMKLINHILHDGLGEGDIKLFCLWFLLLEMYQTLFSILIASFLGILFFLCNNSAQKQPVPFVPFLSIGLILSVYFI